MEPAQKFVLFDFDGVIADSLVLGHSVAREVHPEKEMTVDDYRTLFEGNVYDSLEKAGHQRRDESYFAAYAPRMEAEVGIMPGITEAIGKLAQSYTLVIISSSDSRLIQQFLARNKLRNYFTGVMGSDVHPSKVEKMSMVFEQYDTSPERCVFVTDTLGDMREAKAHEIGAIAVAWGWHDRERLEKGIPFRIVETPAELPDAVDDYFAR